MSLAITDHHPAGAAAMSQSLAVASPSSKNALKEIEKVTKEVFKSLDLSTLELVRLPKQIQNAPWILELDLAHNKLTTIQKKVRPLPFLETLNLSHNSLTECPRALYDFPRLAFLDLSNNKIKKIEEAHGLDKLECLTLLNLSGNDICSLPSSLVSKSSLTIELSENPYSVRLKDEFVARSSSGAETATIVIS